VEKGESILVTDPVTGRSGFDLSPFWSVVWMGVEG
jgi:hypothetical protein